MPIDYSTYSLAELEEALATIDSARYPENKAALDEEIAKRKLSGEYQQELQARQEHEQEQERRRVGFARRAKPWVASYVIASSPLLFLDQVYDSLPLVFGSPFAYLVLGTLYCLGLVVAAIGVARKVTWGSGLLAVFLGFQLFFLHSPGLSVEITSLLKFYLFATGDGSLGVLWRFDPGILVSTSAGNDFAMGIDLITLAFLWVLFVADRGDDGSAD